MENMHSEQNKESNAADEFFSALGNTQASRDREQMVLAAREKLAAEKGVAIEDLTPKDIAKSIFETSPLQADMAIDEIFGAGFAEFMDGPENQDQ